MEKYTDLIDTLTAARDERRPEIEMVVETLDGIFDRLITAGTGEFKRGLRGPDTWSWLDASNIENGFERWIVLGKSTMRGTEGHPLITIRQHTAPRLDSWLTVSQLILGRSAREIETSFAMALANHQGAFEGLREMVANITEMFEQADAIRYAPQPSTPDGGNGMN